MTKWWSDWDGIRPISQPREADSVGGAIKIKYEQISVSSSSSTIEVSDEELTIVFSGQTRLKIDLKFCTHILLEGPQEAFSLFFGDFTYFLIYHVSKIFIEKL